MAYLIVYELIIRIYFNPRSLQIAYFIPFIAPFRHISVINYYISTYPPYLSRFLHASQMKFHVEIIISSLSLSKSIPIWIQTSIDRHKIDDIMNEVMKSYRGSLGFVMCNVCPSNSFEMTGLHRSRLWRECCVLKRGMFDLSKVVI